MNKIYKHSNTFDSCIHAVDKDTAVKLSSTETPEYSLDGILTSGRLTDIDGEWLAAKFVKGEIPKVAEFHIALVAYCGFKCAHCIQDRFRERREDFYENDLKLIIQRAELVNKVLKVFQQKYGTKLIVTFKGGELSTLPLELLTKAVLIATEGLDLHEISFITNLNNTFDYFRNLFTDICHARCNVTFTTSFHEATITTPLNKQKYTSKLLKLALHFNACRSATYSVFNQSSLVSHVSSRNCYNGVFSNGYAPLRMLEDNTYDVKEGLFPEGLNALHTRDGKFVRYDSLIDKGINAASLINSGRYVCWPGFFNFFIGFSNRTFIINNALCELHETVEDSEGQMYRSYIKDDISNLPSDKSLLELFAGILTPKLCSQQCKDGKCNTSKFLLLATKNFTHINLIKHNEQNC